MKRIVFVLIACIFVNGLVGCGGNSKGHEGEAKTPSGSSIQKGRNYQEVIDDFKEQGFKNIKTEMQEDLITGWFTKDGEVESVSVDGDKDYSADDWYPNDVEVVITYHTFPQDEKSAPATPNNGNSEDESKNDTGNLVKETSEPIEQFTAEPTKENDQEILTIENSEDMATLFKAGDSDPIISEFAEKYAGRTIQFDGYIASMTPHEGYKTRFDILFYTGNYGKKSGNALSFKFEDINIVSDLQLTGSNIPENIGEGQNLRITAKVEEYKEVSGLFFLKPVSTEIR